MKSIALTVVAYLEDIRPRSVRGQRPDLGSRDVGVRRGRLPGGPSSVGPLQYYSQVLLVVVVEYFTLGAGSEASFQTVHSF